MKKLILLGLLSGALMAKSIFATFTVEADQEANLAINANGIVKKINVDVGSKVKKGQILLELENSDLAVSIALAKKQVELATLNRKFAKKAYDRFSKVKDVIDEEKFDNYTSSYQRSQIALAKAKTELSLKRIKYHQTRLKAPFNGVISSKEVELGDGVHSARMSTLFKLISEKKQKLVLYVDEKYWKKVKVGQTFTYKIDGTKKSYSEKIAEIYPAIDSKRRALVLIVYTSGLKVGMFGHGKIEVE